MPKIDFDRLLQIQKEVQQEKAGKLEREKDRAREMEAIKDAAQTRLRTAMPPPIKVGTKIWRQVTHTRRAPTSGWALSATEAAPPRIASYGPAGSVSDIEVEAYVDAKGHTVYAFKASYSALKVKTPIWYAGGVKAPSGMTCLCYDTLYPTNWTYLKVLSVNPDGQSCIVRTVGGLKKSLLEQYE